VQEAARAALARLVRPQRRPRTPIPGPEALARRRRPPILVARPRRRRPRLRRHLARPRPARARAPPERRVINALDRLSVDVVNCADFADNRPWDAAARVGGSVLLFNPDDDPLVRVAGVTLVDE